MGLTGILVALALLIGGPIIALVVGQSWGPVSRAQVARFARRQRLDITAGNGEQVIRYLAHTRRWRAAGIVIGVALSIATGLPYDRVGISFGLLFAGWFVGALAAEVRLARGPMGDRRVASLVPRTYRRYVGAFAWWVLPVALVPSVAVFVQAGARGIGQWFGLLASTAIVATTMAVRVRVIQRAQVQLPPDMLAADDAIRSRALHVLSGGGAALVLLCVGGQLARAGYPGAGTLATFAGTGLGWIIGTARFSAVPRVRRSVAA